MPETETNDENISKAEYALRVRVAFAPYWEGRTYDEALTTSLRDLETEDDKNELYSRLYQLLEDESLDVRDNAIDSLHNAFGIECKLDGADRAHLILRLETLCKQIEIRLSKHSDLFETFSSKFFSDYNERWISRHFLSWFAQLRASRGIPENQNALLLALEILFRGCGDSWEAAGVRLVKYLDDPDLNVRACAAYQIGAYCSTKFRSFLWKSEKATHYQAMSKNRRGMEKKRFYWDLMLAKEIERPGVAGAFFQVQDTRMPSAKRWLLKVLELAGQEPYLPLFPCNLGFEAHEIFSDDPAAVKRLMKMGRTRLAVAAASDQSRHIEGMSPLLIELGSDEDEDTVKHASWTLAYYYNILHSKGEQLGYVSRNQERDDSDLYQLFSENRNDETPYAVVLYPKSPGSNWSEVEALALVNQIFPEAVRGKEIVEDYPSPGHLWFERGYYDLAFIKKGESSKRVERITLGYRSETPWNPLQATGLKPAPLN